MDELNNKFSEWSSFNTTHMNRQLGIMNRYTLNLRSWADLLYTRPMFHPEDKEAVEPLRAELANICDETKELYFDMAGDIEKFKEVLELLKEETKRIPSDV